MGTADGDAAGTRDGDGFAGRGRTRGESAHPNALELVHERDVARRHAREARLELLELRQRVRARLLVLVVVQLVAHLLQIRELRQQARHLLLRVRAEPRALAGHRRGLQPEVRVRAGVLATRASAVMSGASRLKIPFPWRAVRPRASQWAFLTSSSGRGAMTYRCEGLVGARVDTPAGARAEPRPSVAMHTPLVRACHVCRPSTSSSRADRRRADRRVVAAPRRLRSGDGKVAEATTGASERARSPLLPSSPRAPSPNRVSIAG